MKLALVLAALVGTNAGAVELTKVARPCRSPPSSAPRAGARARADARPPAPAQENLDDALPRGVCAG